LVSNDHSFASELDNFVGDGTIIAAKFKRSNSSQISLKERWSQLHRKLSEKLGTGTSHLPFSIDATSFQPVPMHGNIFLMDGIGLWQQMPNKLMETEALDRWMQLLDDMQLTSSPLGSLISRNWLKGAPWYSLALSVSSSKGFLSSSVTLRAELFVGGGPQYSPSTSWDSLTSEDRALLDSNQQQQRQFWQTLKAFLHTETVQEVQPTPDLHNNSRYAVSKEAGRRYVSSRLESEECEPIFTASRAVRESRSSLRFTVQDEFRISFPASCALLGNYSAQLSISETIPQFYDMLLHTYTYQVHPLSAPADGTSLVVDSPQFSYSLSDCVSRRPASRQERSHSYSSSNTQNGICDKQLTWQLDLFDAGIPVQSRPIEVVVAVQFTAQKRLIRREYLPADASRGCTIPGGLVTLTFRHQDLPSSKPVFQRLFLTESALVTMPIPDLSMPYNVIMLTSTFAAFFLGSVINAFFRRPKHAKT